MYKVSGWSFVGGVKVGGGIYYGSLSACQDIFDKNTYNDIVEIYGEDLVMVKYN